jgi:hypothetical protein
MLNTASGARVRFVEVPQNDKNKQLDTCLHIPTAASNLSPSYQYYDLLKRWCDSYNGSIQSVVGKQRKDVAITTDGTCPTSPPVFLPSYIAFSPTDAAPTPPSVQACRSGNGIDLSDRCAEPYSRSCLFVLQYLFSNTCI